MTVLMILIALTGLGVVLWRLAAIVRNDGYGWRTPPDPSAWSYRDLPSVPFRDLRD